MASYSELRQLFNDSDLKNRTSVAVVIYANTILDGTLAQKQWAAQVFSSPDKEAEKVLMGVIAANESLTIAQIQGANDAALQTQVNLVAAAMSDAFAGV